MTTTITMMMIMIMTIITIMATGRRIKTTTCGPPWCT